MDWKHVVWATKVSDRSVGKDDAKVKIHRQYKVPIPARGDAAGLQAFIAELVEGAKGTLPRLVRAIVGGLVLEYQDNLWNDLPSGSGTISTAKAQAYALQQLAAGDAEMASAIGRGMEAAVSLAKERLSSGMEVPSGDLSDAAAEATEKAFGAMRRALVENAEEWVKAQAE